MRRQLERGEEDATERVPIGANLPRMRERATTEQSMKARTATFPSRLVSPLAELRVFIFSASLRLYSWPLLFSPREQLLRVLFWQSF
jgi:hypothetical protein